MRCEEGGTNSSLNFVFSGGQYFTLRGNCLKKLTLLPFTFYFLQTSHSQLVLFDLERRPSLQACPGFDFYFSGIKVKASFVRCATYPNMQKKNLRMNRCSVKQAATYLK